MKKKSLIFLFILITILFTFISCNIGGYKLNYTIEPDNAGTVSIRYENDKVHFVAFPNDGYSFYEWKGDYTGDDILASMTIDEGVKENHVTAKFVPAFFDDFETNDGNFSTLHDWNISGDSFPFIQQETISGGAWSVEFGDLNDDQESYFETTVNFQSPTKVSFNYKVSCEDSSSSFYDGLRFYVDDEIYGEFDGDVDWTSYVSEEAIQAGEHVLKWAYEKDGSVTEGLDKAWVDDIGSGGGHDNSYFINLKWNSPNENSTITMKDSQETNRNNVQKPDKMKTQTDKEEHKKFDSIIVRFKENINIKTKNNQIKTKYQKYGTVKYNPINPKFNYAVIKPNDTKNADWKSIMDYYKSLPEVLYVEPNQYLKALEYIPNDPRYDEQWNMTLLNMPTVWDYTMGDSEIVVAVIDTGVAVGLSDSPINIDTDNDYDSIDEDNNAHDEHYHGTHVAGTVAQNTNNSEGVAGMAPNTTILPIRVLDADGYGTNQQVADGIIWAADNGADIINMSLGDHTDDDDNPDNQAHQLMYDACQYAYEAGVTIFAASGNDSDSRISWPARFDNTISVGSVTMDKERAYYSNAGKYLDIVAPGGETGWSSSSGGVLQQTSDGDYEFLQGTSMACPHAAGFGALLKALDPSLTPTEMRAVMTLTAEDLGEPGRDDIFGFGLINPLTAFNYVQGESYEIDITQSFTYNSVEQTGQVLSMEGLIEVSIYFKNTVDFDLYLCDSEGNEVASSKNSNTGYEAISYDVSDNKGIYQIKVIKK